MQKFTFLFFALFALTNYGNAQVDVQINPIGALFSSIDLSVEVPVSQAFGIDGALGYDFQNFKFDDIEYKNNAVGFRAIGKYYFNPQNGTDRWNVGAYLRFSNGTSSVKDDSDPDREDVKNTKLAIGFYAGHKWVSR